MCGGRRRLLSILAAWVGLGSVLSALLPTRSAQAFGGGTRDKGRKRP